MPGDDFLRYALERKPAPAGMKAKILARAQRRQRGSQMRCLAMAASVALVTVGSWQYREYQQEEQARETLRQVQVAAAITNRQLAKAQLDLGESLSKSSRIVQRVLAEQGKE